MEEQLIYNDELGDCYIDTFSYIYDCNNEKLYYDKDEENFFKYDPIYKEAIYIEDGDSIKAGDSKCRYKALSVLWGSTSNTEYKKIYQVLNGRDKGRWYIDIYGNAKTGMAQANPDDITTKIDASLITKLGISCDLLANYSDINYYVEAYTFTNWVKQNLKDVHQQVYNKETKKYETITIDNIFYVSADNDPESEESIFVQHKRKIQEETIRNDLDLAIYNYSRGTKSFNLPIPSYSDWELAIKNISFMAFLQGIPCGMKTYNNYFISTSLGNKEFVEPSQLYYVSNDVDFHRIYCSHCTDTKYTAYRNVEFQVREVETLDDNMGYDGTAYYYPHDKQNKINTKTKQTIENNEAETACYYCIINKASYEKTENDRVIGQMTKAYTEAIARERYEQKAVIGKSVDDDTGIEILPPTDEPPGPAATPQPTPAIIEFETPAIIPSGDFKRGDVNCDGNVTVTDLVMLKKYIVFIITLQEQGQRNADVDQNGIIGVSDLLILKKYLVNLPTNFIW